MVVFFAQILCSAIYIFGIQIKGELGHNNDPHCQRFKYDALSYYKEDIDWFAYMLVLLALHIWILTKHMAIPSKVDNTLKEVFSGYMIVFSLIRMMCLMPYRYNDRTFKVIDNKIWGCMFLLELVGAIFIVFMHNISGSNTFASQIIDTIGMIFMFALYKYNMAANEEPPENR